MKLTLASLFVALAMAACANQPAQAGTGFRGVVQVGPACPVERIDSPCPPHPLAATVVVRNGSGVEVLRFHSGPDGRFTVDIAPGTYSVVGLNIGASMLPRPIPTTVTVTQGSYATLNVQYDSGIR